MTEYFEKLRLKNKDLKLYNNDNWYDITVLCVLLGLELIAHNKTDIKICVLPEGQLYDNTSFKQFDAALKDNNIAIIINFSNVHYSALYLKKGQDKIALYNDPLGSDTPVYIENKCREIQYTVTNNRIKLQAINDNNNCGPLTLYTLVQFSLDKKLVKPKQKLLTFAENRRKHDQDTLVNNGINNTTKFFEKFDSDIEKMIVDSRVIDPPQVIDVTDNNIVPLPKKKPELNLKLTNRYKPKEFIYQNYDENSVFTLPTK